MMEKASSTEDKLFEAARKVFQEQGYDGARMQAIAKRAGINQSMLHYYFRTKDKLFDAVFKTAAQELLARVLHILQSDLPLHEKIERFVHTYIDQITANPDIPAFILQELRRNPDRIKQLFGESAINIFASLERQVREAAAQGLIRPIEPEHLLAHMISLCVFPFVGRPMLQTAFGADDAGYAVFLEARKEEVTRFILNALKP